MKYNELTFGQMEAIVNKLGGMEGVNDFLSGKTEIVNKAPKWTKKDGRIYFSITVLGLTAEEEQIRAEEKGHTLSDWAKDVLAQPDYNQKHRAEPGKVYNMVLIRGKEIKKDSERTTKNLKVIAVKDFSENSVSGLKAELVFRIREKFSNKDLKEMGLWQIVVLHEPIVDSDGDPSVLYSDRIDDESCVGAGYGGESGFWDDYGAFAFLQD